ncbi:MAG: limonene-1,2-epoxide hydrolase family protein [Pseudomonadales bacterium]|nr:nuclear transport factor 2 family protein [Pseudomonadales bacterium]
MKLRFRLIRITGIVLLACLGFLPVHAATPSESPRSNEAIVREFIAAWSRLDADELVGYFASDGTYHNMPMAPVTGHEKLREFIGGFLASWEKTDWQIINLLVDGDVVFAERIDRTHAAGRYVELPCAGVFEMENGRIKVWRDYFDLATFTNAVTPPRD